MLIYRDGRWWAWVTNWYGVTVWGDNSGKGGFAGLFDLTCKMTAAVRLMDGIGQGKRMRSWSEL